MSFGREIKDFLDAYGKGADRAQKDVQIKQTGDYYKTLAAAQAAKAASDPSTIYGAAAAATPNLGARDTGAIPGASLPAAPAQKISAAILGQESGNDPNAPTSVDGAVGRAQIMPATFAAFAKPGENIDNPADNLAVHNRIIGKYAQAYGNDPARVAVAYFSGPGNVAPPGSPTPWKADHTDGNGKSVSGYVSDVARRLGRQAQAIPMDGSDDPSQDPSQAQTAQFAADGGLIDDPTYNDKAEYFAQQAAQDQPAPAPQQAPQQALPADVDATASSNAPAPASVPITPDPDPDTMQMVQMHATLPEALHAGLTKLQDMFGLKAPGAIDDGSQAAAQKGFVASTAGVVPPAQLDALHKAVDPDDKLTPALKNLAGINAVYQHYMSIGDIDKAQKAAASLIQTTRVAVATFGHAAEAQLKAGNVPGAVASLQKADALTPTGTQIVPSKPDAQGNGTYAIKNTMTGQTIKTGNYTPGDLMAMAGIAANGTGYFNAVAKVAAPALPDEDTDDSASKAAFTRAMGGLGGGAATPPPQFNNAAYAQMNKEHQAAYARAYSVQLQQRKASQPKPGKPEKPASMKEVNELSDGVGSALDKHLANVVNPSTLDPYGDVEKAKAGLGEPTYQAIRNLGIGIARQAGLPHDSAASAALQLVDVDPADPSNANFDYAKDKNGRPVAGPDGMVPVVVGTQAGVPTRIKLRPEQLAQVQILRQQLNEKLADEAVKRDTNPPLVPKILRGAADVFGGTKAALAGNGPSMAGTNSYAAAQRRMRQQALPLGDTNVAGQ